MSLNPGPLMLGVLVDIVASHDFDFLCLTETHARLSDTNTFLQSVTPPDFIFRQRPFPSGIGVGFSLDPTTNHIK